MRRDPTADALAEAFPGTTEFVVMRKADWDVLMMHLRWAGVPVQIRDMCVQHIELERQ
jgi:hypothetical protein